MRARIPTRASGHPGTCSWPPPADPRAAGILAERLREAAGRALPRGATVRAAIAAIGGNSPFLADLAVREHASFRRLLADGPDGVAADALAAIRALPDATPRRDLAAALRTAKRRIALATAYADLGGLWPLERVTATLSDFADAALVAATDHLVRAHGLLAPTASGAEGSGFAVLAMGKLGAGELNYSSDIDLFLLHDRPDIGSGTLARLARELAALMETRDGDGYVFRVDLRLRPDPGTTPPAVALEAALTYYEAMAETWERAALSKARPVAGDLGLGARFLESLRPFVWRRHLDFAAIGDMRAMKTRIDRHRGTGLADAPPADAVGRLLGHDLKLGWGGIREIEFTAQTMQLVWGGREPALRARATLPALAGLAASGHLARSDATALAAAYRLLRTAEHRLQMVADRQTHALPTDRAAFAAFALFMGETDPGAFAHHLLTALTRVHEAYEGALFDPAPARPGSGSGDRGGDAPALPADPETFRALGFARPEAAAALAARWSEAPPRALRSERARRLLAAVLETLLPALGSGRDPDAAFVRFDRLIERLPSGVQLLSLLAANPPLLERIAMILGAAPALADHLAAVPAALEGLLAAEDVAAAPKRTLAREIAGRPDGDTVEVAIETARRFVRGEEFRLALAELSGRLDVDSAGRARTALAEATIAALLPRILAAHRRRYGRVAGGGAVLVALGKAGSREMMSGSDLDLMLVYDHHPEAGESTGGERALPAGTYFARLAQGLIGALTAPGPEGALYAVDMRLRPSGSKGPVAVSLPAFRSYHADRAWTWERMALTRARVVAGTPRLRRALEDAIADALDGAGAPARIRADAVDMRARLARERRPEGAWDVKLRPGGLMEVEFIAQALQLGAAVPREARSTSTAASFAGLARAGLLGRDEARQLAAADRLWRRVQSLLRLLEGPRVPRDPLSAATTAALEHATGESLAALAARMEATGHSVRGIFTRRLGVPHDP